MLQLLQSTSRLSSTTGRFIRNKYFLQPILGTNLRSVVSQNYRFNSTQQQQQEWNLTDPECNIPAHIHAKIGRNLHLKQNHPLYIIKKMIQRYWKENQDFQSMDDMAPLVSTYANFDSLNIPLDHVSRSKSDTYYYSRDEVLRTHTSAHQVELLERGHDRFLVTGDVYRRDEIDSSHYPIFHQMEGVKIFNSSSTALLDENDREKMIEEDLKQGLEGMTRILFGDVEMKWVDAYFPFTHPSFELEIYYNEKWMEVLGCGIIHPQILRNANRDADMECGWAFGLGLERLAMILFGIPDIRLFWTNDPRFHNQFTSSSSPGNVKFQPYSKFPPCYKDISFWIPTQFHANDLHEIIRNVGGDLVEDVALLDEFTHPKTKRISHCYRINYRSMDRNLTNEEIDKLQELVRKDVETMLEVELR